MSYVTLVAGSVITASWANANVRDQMISPFASSAARDAAITSPINGMIATTTDIYGVWLYSSGWIQVGPLGTGWTSYTPGLLQSGSPTKTTNYARWMRIGRLISCEGFLTVTATGGAVGSNLIEVAVPIGAASTWRSAGGSCGIYDSSAGTYYPAYPILHLTTHFAFHRTDVNGSDALFLGISGLTDALNNGDQISWSIMYEAAA